MRFREKVQNLVKRPLQDRRRLPVGKQVALVDEPVDARVAELVVCQGSLVQLHDQVVVGQVGKVQGAQVRHEAGHLWRQGAAERLRRKLALHGRDRALVGQMAPGQHAAQQFDERVEK